METKVSMSVSHLNPHYRPDAAQVISERQARYRKLAQDMDYVAETSALSHLGENIALTLERAHTALLESYRMQHRTIQEYADWYFKTFPVEIEGKNSKEILRVDTAPFTKCEEVEKVWSDMQVYAQKQSLILKGSMPSVSHGVFSGGIHTKKTVIDTGVFKIPVLVTSEESQAIHRYCLMQDPASHGPSVLNLIDELATAIYFDRIKYRLTSETLLSKSLETLLKAFNRHIPVHPGECEFYIHVPPEYGGREQFLRADMEWEDGGYVQPRIVHFSTIPAAVRNARFAFDTGPRIPPLGNTLSFG